MILSKNFTLAELIKSDVAIRHNINNTPNAGEINNLRELVVNVLQPIRDHYKQPVKVSSGYRTYSLNKTVGGSKTSDHMQGFAADIEVTGTSNYDLALWISKNLKFTQVILEFYIMGNPYSGWVHVSYDPKSLKHQALTAIKKDGKTVYLNGLIA
jgi:hypothetical protein